ncbi:p21-activated kinase 1 [Fasciola gigantica]|uniref:p21-activated kinase 1 n=1 Tax=Fasciola gigantica TaxID=46835 RepID=A0A504YP14_FASGI|nr:p21-activated kinase 1 [Fasciola gigantica]
MTVQPPLLSPLAHAPNSAHGMQPPRAESFVSSIEIDGKSDPKLTTSVTSADYHARVTTAAPHDSPYISRSTLAGPPPLSLGVPRRFANGILPPETATPIQYSSGQSSPSTAGSVIPVPTTRRESLSASAVPARAGLNHTVPGALNTATELSAVERPTTILHRAPR